MYGKRNFLPPAPPSIPKGTPTPNNPHAPHTLQVKGPAPDNEWHSFTVPGTPSKRHFGALAGVSGSMNGGSTLVHCGGLDFHAGWDYIQQTDDCFALRVQEDGLLELSVVAPLPHDVASSCHGSDGDRMVIAGGYI